jgi:PhnB protein
MSSTGGKSRASANSFLCFYARGRRITAHTIMEAIMTQKTPEGFSSVTPSLNVTDAAKAIEQYKKAFGAKEMYRMEMPDGSGKIMHACLEIGNSKLFIADVNPQMGCGVPSVASFYVYLDNVDAAFKQAKEAGLEEQYTPKDMFWGDRTGTVKDSFGVMWTLATHVRDVSADEMEEAKKSFGKAA